jgi:hypothetical protein
MKSFCGKGMLVLMIVVMQGCMTTHSKKIAVKKNKIPPARTSDSYALMDETIVVDRDVSRRGVIARGLDEY